MGAHLGLHLKNERKTKFIQLRVNETPRIRRRRKAGEILVGCIGRGFTCFIYTSRCHRKLSISVPDILIRLDIELWGILFNLELLFDLSHTL